MSIWKIKLPPFGGRQEVFDDLYDVSRFFMRQIVYLISFCELIEAMQPQ